MSNSEGSNAMFSEVAKRFTKTFAQGEVPLPPVGVRFIPKDMEVPRGTRAPKKYQGITWCKAVRIAATKGEVVVINKGNVGCPAAAIALGFVDAYQLEPLKGKREYTDLMQEPASPADFTNGLVYACKDSGNMRFALFGKDDVGRYETLGEH